MDRFAWRIHATEHFDIHFTPDAAALIPRVAELLEEAHARIPKDLGVEVGRTPFFLYTTHNRFEQTPIVDVGEGTGGVTEAFKNRLLIYNDGSDFWLSHVIPHEFTHVVQFEALYGGFWRSARLLKSPFYPLWFLEGLAEYESGEGDQAEEDMYLRDAATRGALYPLAALRGFNHLKPHQVTLGYKQGGAAVRFLAEQYGTDKPGRLLRALRERFEETALVEELTGERFEVFDRRYRAHLTERYAAQAAALGLEEPEAYGRRLTPASDLPVFHTAPALCADGRRLAYISDASGTPVLFVRDRVTGQEEARAGAPSSRLDRLHADERNLSFSPDGRWIAFVGEKDQRDYLYFLEAATGRLRRVRLPFTAIRSPAFAPDGKRLAVAAQVEGRKDLFEVTPRGKILRRLTNTPVDEDHPAYSPDGTELVFSREGRGAEGRPDRALHRLNLRTGEDRLLADLPRNDGSPVYTPEGRGVVFVGEGREAIRNLYRVELEDGRVTQLTRVIGGNFSPAFSRAGGVSVFASYRGNAMHLYEARESLWGGGSPLQAVEPPPPAEREEAPAGTPAGASRPYRMRASTDLIFPAFFYSSDAGLYLAALWQASDMAGRHGLRSVLQYVSKDQAFDYNVEYAYRRFRPELFVSAAGEGYYNDVERTERRDEAIRTAGVRHPLDRFWRLEGILSSIHRRTTNTQAPEQNVEEKDDSVEGALVMDNTRGRWLAITSGGRLRLASRKSVEWWGGDRDYLTHELEAHRFLPTGGDGALGLRWVSGVSRGSSPEEVRLGGVDRIRGVPSSGYRAPRYAFLNAEWRTPLAYFDARGPAVLPGVVFKGLFGGVFADTGAGWTSESERKEIGWSDLLQSVGGRLSLPGFVLQSFFFQADFTVAKRTDNGDWSVYLSLGPEF